MAVTFFTPSTNCEYVYWKKVLDIIDEDESLKSLNFYFIQAWDWTEHIDCFRKDSVVICFGERDHEGRLDYVLPYEKALVVFKEHIPDNHKIENLFPVPLGYHKYFVDVPYIPIEDRNIDIFFSGQRCGQGREEMWVTLDKLRGKNLNINANFTPYFMEGLSGQEYSKCLMNSKIALCPFGMSRETYRFHEAMKSGTIAVSCPLSHPFHANSPYVRLNNWNELPKIEGILNDEKLLKDLHKSHLDWWDTSLSEKASSAWIKTIVQRFKL